MLTQLLEATLTSLWIFFLTIVLSLPLGVIVARGRMSKSKVVSGLVNIYIMIMRGTPLMLQILFVYFAPYYLVGISYDRFTAVIIAFTINYAAYFAEIYRGGMQTLHKGQIEAAASLGLSKWQSFVYVIVPQVFKIVLPSIGNEVITLVKDTALAQTIGVAELFRSAQTMSSRMFSVVPIFVAGIFYFIMNAIVAKAFDIAEKRLKH
ncbi:MAG: amino acid ABC transporter permease [Sphaerochaetaceae bacterium]|nr:amino acid ABC transporter permease [Sphaerochaetaceae bacterium]